MAITIPTPVDALAEIIRDIEVVHGVGAAALASEWPDLHATYEMAKQVLEQPPAIVVTHPSATATASVIRTTIQAIIDDVYNIQPADCREDAPAIMDAIVAAESDEEVVLLGRAFLLWLDGPGTDPDYKTTGRRCHSHVLAIAKALHLHDTPAPVGTPEPGISYRVTIWYQDQITHQATRYVTAPSEKDAAEIVKQMAEANKLDFECVGSEMGPYGFEVATPSSGTISWQED